MISRLKRQTKKRHSVKRVWRHSRYAFLATSTTQPTRITVDLDVRPIIGAPFSPDVWAP